MTLYFKNKLGIKHIIAFPKTEEEAIKEINKFCSDRNFNVYYTRTWVDEDGLKWFDVGSWSEFFVLSKED